mgnify:CR=1 FL=1
MASRTDITGAALTYGYPALASAAIVLIMSVDALRLRILGGGGSQVSNDARQVQFDMAPPVLMRSPVFGFGGGRGAVLGFRVVRRCGYDLSRHAVTTPVCPNLPGVVR